MAFGLWHLLEASLLVMNSLAILNEKRFLKRWGLDQAQVGGSGSGSLQNQAATLLHAMRTFMKYPLIIANIFFILSECFFG